MVAIADAILVLCPAAVFDGPGVQGNVSLVDDGTGPRIVRWDAAALGPQPTPDQLAAVTPEQVAAARAALVRTLTPLEWLDRLTVSRQIDVMTAVDGSPAAKLWWTKLQMAVEIDLDSQTTKDGVAYLVAGGVLTQAEADVLLA